MLNYITWNADPAIFDGFITIRWYGLMFAIGFLIGYDLVARMFKREGAPEKWLGTFLIYLVVATIVGARLGHVFFYEWDVYKLDPIRILYIWEGGLASHGGTLANIIGVFMFSYFVTKRNPLWAFDRVVVAIALVGGLIRIGNLFNSEIFGTATTLPWGFMFVRSREWMEFYMGQACHPTQLYEALCYFALFGLLMWMYWKKNAGERPGLLLGTFFIGIFLPRFFIEFIKNDQVAREATMTLNIGQQLSIPFIIAGVLLVIYALKRPRQHIDYPNCYAEQLQKRK